MVTDKRILVVTCSIDKTVDYIIAKYSALVTFFRFDVDLFNRYHIDIGNSNGSWSISDTRNGETLKKSDTLSIYYRKPMYPNLEEYEVQYRPMIQMDILAVVSGIVDSFEGRVLSKPYLMRRAENKINQLLFAVENNFLYPKSFIGNTSSRCISYSKEKSIIKPISTGKTQGKNGTELYGTSYFVYDGQDISLTPIYLQEYIEKQYEVRITVVGEYFYAVRIDTADKLDWRSDYVNHHYALIDCPPAVKKSCITILKHYDLLFGAFDYIVTPKDEWVFLEVNPNGQWLWLEESLGLDISKKVVSYLLGEAEA